MNIINYSGYEGTAELDMERGICRGKILFIDDVVTYQSKSIDGLQAAFEEAVDDYVATCKELGRSAQKPASGVFNVRVKPELHRSAKLRAAADDTSLNDVVAAALDCYVNGVSHVTTTHNHISLTRADDVIDVYSAGIAADQAMKGVIARVLQ